MGTLTINLNSEKKSEIPTANVIVFALTGSMNASIFKMNNGSYGTTNRSHIYTSRSFGMVLLVSQFSFI